MRLLYTLGGPEYDDPPEYDDNDYTTWGVRRRLFYGLEQFITTVKLEKGEFTAINEKNYKNIVPPVWMFSKDADGSPLPVRPEDVMYKAVGYPEPPAPGNEDWTNCFRFIDTLSELLSNKGESGGKYNIVEDLISLIDKIFTEVDASEENIRGLRHTLGAILTRYNEMDRGWEYPDDLLHVLEDQLPEILEIFRGHYRSLLVLADAVMNSKGREENFMEYFMKNLKSEYSTKDVIEQLHDFLGTDLINRPDSALWTDLAELLISFVEMIEVNNQPDIWFEEDTFHSNKGLEDMDPFTAIGELLSW